MKGAAIDLGSNSFICYVFDFTDGQIKTLEDKIILTRLSEGVDQSKALSNAALKRSEQAFKEFQQLFQKHGVTNIQAVATSAARDASNQDEFLELANRFDIPVKILSGVEEAILTFEGVKENFRDQKGLIIDIGGGSTEFVYVTNGSIQDRVSLNVGVVRFTERFLKGQNFKDYEAEIRGAIKKEFTNSSILNEFKNSEIDVFLAVSGTPTSAASILAGGFDPEKIQGFFISREDLRHLIESYGYLPLDQRLVRYPFVEAKRADVLPTGLLILDEALKAFNMKGYKVSNRGIRHGLARSMCSLDV